MLLFYFLILTFIVLVAIGGYDATMRLVQYADLTIRYQFIRLKMHFIRERLKRQLIKDREQLLKEVKKDVGHERVP